MDNEKSKMIKRTDKEIERLRKKLVKFCVKNDLFYESWPMNRIMVGIPEYKKK